MDTSTSDQTTELVQTTPGSDRDSQRLLHRKTRTGCIRCKRCHVKCDETKPQCQRGIKIRVRCPGYDAPKIRLLGISINECFASEIEKSCFDSFMTVDTIHLAKFQPSARTFWQSVVPQLGQVYPAIRQATIAISVLVQALTADFYLESHERRVLDGSGLHDPLVAANFAPMVRHYFLDTSAHLDRYQAVNLDCGNRFELSQWFFFHTVQRHNVSVLHEMLTVLVKYAISHYLQDSTGAKLTDVLRSRLEESRIATIQLGNATGVPSRVFNYFKRTTVQLLYLYTRFAVTNDRSINSGVTFRRYVTLVKSCFGRVHSHLV